MSGHTSIRWGIDLGTTNSSMAAVHGDAIAIVKNEFMSELTPSVVAFKRRPGPPEVQAVGQNARQRLKRDPEVVARRFKGQMGHPEWGARLPGADRSISARELSGHVLAELRNSLALLEGLPPLTGAVVTVPAVFRGPERDDTLRAAEGIIPYVELLPEPIAAALAFGRTMDTSHNPVWLVYDLGGGTFDAALVRAEDGVFTVIDNDGDRNLGGADLDAVLVKECVLSELDGDARRRIAAHAPHLETLEIYAEEAKCELSVPARRAASLDVELGEDSVVVSIRREKVEALQVRMFGRTIRICRDLMERNGYTAGSIDRVILVGGPTLSPFLRRMIQHGADDPSGGGRVEGLGIPLDQSVSPLTAVAQGAAIYAASRRLPAGVVVPGPADEGALVTTDVQAPGQVLEQKALVAGRVRALHEDVAVGASWGVVVERVNGTGSVTWTSTHVPLSANGTFSQPVSLEAGMNEFRIRVFDQDRRPVRGDAAARFEILRGIGITEITLPRGFGIADPDGRTVWFFRKGQPLNTERTLPLRTTTTLKRGGSAELIVIPVVEGFSDKASLNLEVYRWRISADDAGVDVPAGARLEVTLTLDQNQSPSRMVAVLPDYGVTLSFERFSTVVDPTQVRSRLTDAKKNLELFERVMQESATVASVVKDVAARRLVAEIEENLTAGSTEDPRPWRKAADLALELARLLDPHREEVDRLLAWLPQKALGDQNVQKAMDIVADTSGVGREWRSEFVALCERYAAACARHDRRESWEIAFSLIPEHFKRDEQLRQRVGRGGVDQPGAAGSTVEGQETKGRGYERA